MPAEPKPPMKKDERYAYREGGYEVIVIVVDDCSTEAEWKYTVRCETILRSPPPPAVSAPRPGTHWQCSVAKPSSVLPNGGSGWCGWSATPIQP